MKHKRKTRRAPQKHGSSRKKKTMRRRHVRSKAKKHTGGFFKNTRKAISRSFSKSKGRARATAIIKRYRERLEQLLYDTFKGVSDKFPIVPTVQDLRDAGTSEDKIKQAAYDLCDATVKEWPVEPTEQKDINKLEKRLHDAFHDAKKRIKKDETKTKEKEQEICDREDYKYVVKAIAKPHIQVGDVETIVNYIFEDDLPEGLTEVKDLKDLKELKDPIKKLEKIIKEELDIDTNSKKWLQEKLSDSVKEEIKRRTNTDKVAGIWNKLPATVLPDQSKISESGRQLPDPGSFIFLRKKNKYPDYGLKLAMVTCIDDETVHYVVCNEEGVFMTDDKYMQMQDLRPLTLENETFLWTRTEQEELNEINQDHKRLLSEEGLARISPPFATAPPAPQYRDDPVVVLAEHVQEENTHNESSVKQP